jgi:GNAT superfamily N-acetyltransferase
MRPRTKYLTVPAAWGGRPCATRVQYPAVLDGPLEGFNFGKDGCATAWFWTIVRELENDEGMAWMHKHGTWYEFLLQAWRDNRILGLRMQDTDNLVRVRHQRQRSPTPNEAQALLEKHFMFSEYHGASEHVLPCFLVTSADGRRPGGETESGEETGEVIEFMWVAPRVRRCGIGAYLEQHYPHAYVERPTEAATGFWHKLGFSEEAEAVSFCSQ